MVREKLVRRTLSLDSWTSFLLASIHRPAGFRHATTKVHQSALKSPVLRRVLSYLPGSGDGAA